MSITEITEKYFEGMAIMYKSMGICDRDSIKADLVADEFGFYEALGYKGGSLEAELEGICKYL